MNIEFKRLTDNAKVPDRTFHGDAGADLYAIDDVTINPGEWLSVSTGLTFSLPEGVHAEIRPRSGLALKHGVTVLNAPGTIDSGYRGEIKVVLINHGRRPFVVKPGDGIAQAVFIAHLDCAFIETDEVESSERSEFGFGSG